MSKNSKKQTSHPISRSKHTPKSGKTAPTFDDDKWEKLCEILKYKPRLRDCAGLLDCHINTIENEIRRRTGLNFCEFRSERMAGTRQTLVKLALDRAQKGSDTMLIFSLKNMCGWSDRVLELEAADIDDLEFTA